MPSISILPESLKPLVLSIGLTQYVSRYMERALGDKWQIRGTRKARGDRDFTLDDDDPHEVIVAAVKRVWLTASDWQHC